jgi:lysyl-tRNA synthetase class I
MMKERRVTNEERLELVYASMEVCYWCADQRCEHNQRVAQTIVEHWSADVQAVYDLHRGEVNEVSGCDDDDDDDPVNAHFDTIPMFGSWGGTS